MPPVPQNDAGTNENVDKQYIITIYDSQKMLLSKIESQTADAYQARFATQLKTSLKSQTLIVLPKYASFNK